ncbi:P-loop containing nucleoside triphosphate hydrolase protein [Podospora conica]|nr:P-loop containing nucleoside triphosphate hydrolase protein [Schizothecium conicum]
MSDDEQDPLSWDTDRLVQELCARNQSWSPNPATLKLPKPAELEKMIRDHDLDGMSFLTYADDFGIPELWRNLNICNMRHQQSLYGILTQLRKSSRQYKRWKKERERQQAESDDTDVDTPDTTKADQAPASPHDTHPPQARPPPEATAELLPPAPPPKKRMVPTNLDTNPVFSRAFISTEADMLDHHRQQDDVFEASVLGSDVSPDDFLSAHLNNPVKAYLGRSLRVDHIAEESGAETDADEDETICWVRQQALPPGRCVQVARYTRRLLRRRASPGHDKDKILPDYGESDSGDEFDSETWKEIEAERRSHEAAVARRAAKQATQKTLSPDELLDKIVKDLERGWATKKKPKHDYGAREFWDNARRSGDREAQLRQAKDLEKRLTERAATVRKKLIDEGWFDDPPKEREELARGALGATIEDLELAKWKKQTLQSVVPPPRPATLPKPLPKAPRIRKQIADDDDDDGETISDDSDRGGYLSDGPIHDEPIQDEHIHDEPIHDEPMPESDAMQVDVDADTESEPMQLDSEPETGPEPMAESPSLPTMPVKSERPPPVATPARLRAPAAEVIRIDSSPIVILDDDEIPGLHDTKGILETGIKHWQKVGDRQRLTIAVFCGWPQERRAMVAEAISKHSASEVWDSYISPVLGLDQDGLNQLARDAVDFALVRLFDCYIGTVRTVNTAHRYQEQEWLTAPLKPMTCMRITREHTQFPDFHKLLLGTIADIKASESTPSTNAQDGEATTPEPNRGSPLEPCSSIRRAPTEVDVDEEDVEKMIRDVFEPDSPGDKPRARKGNHTRDPHAANMVRTTYSQGKAFKERGQKLQVQLLSEALQSQSQDSNIIDRSRLVVNLSKDPDDALIYINDHIGAKIKDHQIDGVRFMWNNVVKSSLGQGCLLAHEMGLGKTMQTITLLTVIAEASQSEDETIVRQIPHHLRKSKTLVTCPAGLVDNWVQEFAAWAPNQLLGHCFKIDAQVKTVQERLDMARQWAQQGGILVCTYDIFASMSGQRAGGEQSEESAEIMQNNANIAIADEAHFLKNIKTQRASAHTFIRTTSRIALTGSPLTKYVMNYYALIGWVAPGYLGEVGMFTARFHKPIEKGLFCDSLPADKRKSRRQLAILRTLVEPIVHRNDAKVLHETLPGKKEFIIGLKLTPTQLNAYDAYIRSIRSGMRTKEYNSMVRVWSLVTYLSALVGHPVIFKKKLEDKKTKQVAMGNVKTPKKKKKKKSADDADADADDDEDEDAELSNDLISELLAYVNDRNIEDIVHSNKMRVLFCILDESRRVGDKVLIFSQSLMALDYLQNVFTRQKRNFSRMDGSTKASTRQKSVQDFNEDPKAEIYLISTTAGCVGLNITGANRVVIFDFKYTPADEQQAIGRSYRIGQLKKVYVYWLIVAGTFEQTLHSSAIFKKQLAQRVVDKQNPDPTSSKLKDYFKPPEVPTAQDLSPFKRQDRILDCLIRDFAGDIVTITPTETFETEEVFEFDDEDRRDIQTGLQELQKPTVPGPHGINQRNGDGWGLRPAHRAGPPKMGALPRGPPSTQPSGLGDQMTQRAPARQVVPYTGSLPSGRPALEAGPGPSTQPAASSRPRGAATGFSSPSPSEDPFLSTVGATVPHFSPFLRPANRPKIGLESSKTAPSPILAVGTHVAKSPQAKKTVLGTDDHLFNTLAGFYKKIASQRFKGLLQPSDILRGINGELKRHGLVTGLPKMAKMQTIVDHATKQRFSEALLFGYLKPESVASAAVADELDSIAKSIDGLSTEEFKREVRKGQEGPDVGVATLTPPAPLQD